METRASFHIGRIAAAAIAAEVLGVAILALFVAIFGPPGFEAARPFAERSGAWVGPISGFTLCLAGGYWVARSAAVNKVQDALCVGVAAAALDMMIALALGAGVSTLLVLSNVGRVVGAAAGGWLASGTRNGSRG